MPSEPQRAAVALPEAGRRTATSASGPEPRAKSVVREYGEALLVALLLALFIRSFIVQAFKIPSGSMIPTLQIGDHILVNKFVYGVRIPYFYVTAISEVPMGAHPTACYPFYAYDRHHTTVYYEAARKGAEALRTILAALPPLWLHILYGSASWPACSIKPWRLGVLAVS